MKGILIAGAAGAGIAFVIIKGSQTLNTAKADGTFPAGEFVAKNAPYVVGALAAIALHKFMPQAV